MIKKIKNHKELQEFLSSDKGTGLFGKDNQKLKSELQTMIKIFDSQYGANRNTDKDLGGWLGILTQTVADEHKEIREALAGHSDESLYEYEDCYLDTSDPALLWKIRLYICSADYALVLVYNIRKEVK